MHTRAALYLKHSPLPRGLFGRQRKPPLDLSAFDDARRDVFAQRGAVFEPMAGAASYQPYVVEIGMAVDQEIAVRSVLVLADARFDQGLRSAVSGSIASP